MSDVSSTSGPAVSFGGVDTLLRLAREQLGMDVGLLTRFEDDACRIRNVSAVDESALVVGRVVPRSDCGCQLVATHVIAETIPDARLDPRLRELEWVREMDVRAYVGVALHRADGELYGALSAFSHRPQEALHQRDADVLHAMASVLMEIVEAEDADRASAESTIEAVRAVLSAGGPEVVLQPVRSLATGRVVSHEALSRFTDGPDPAGWFAAAGRAGIGAELERAAVERAVDLLERVGGRFSVNLSAATICAAEFQDWALGLPLHRLIIEITEHQPVHDYPALLRALDVMRRRGAYVAVDDAGSGYASLRHAVEILPDYIKLDIALVRGIHVDPRLQALASALCTFAERTGSHIVAEGVEDADEADCLRTLGVEYAQGYFLGRPAPAPALRTAG